MKIITQSQFKEKFNHSYDLLNKSYNLKKHLNYLNMKIKYNFRNVILSSDNLIGYHYSKGVDFLSWPRVNMSS